MVPRILPEQLLNIKSTSAPKTTECGPEMPKLYYLHLHYIMPKTKIMKNIYCLQYLSKIKKANNIESNL